MARITAQEAGGVIYALTEPGGGAVRYVGHTTQPLAERLGGHISAAKTGASRPVCLWIVGLLDGDERPGIRVLEKLSASDDWQEREQAWISQYRSGESLLNLTAGGLGWLGHTHSAEERAKIGAAHRGKTISLCQRQKQSAAMGGRRLSKETRQKISDAMAGREFPAETRARISAAKLGRPIPNASGALNHRAILTAEAVEVIRLGEIGPQDAKQMWGISKSQFYRVKRGEQWRSAA